jgi:hypothetical protein
MLDKIITTFCILDDLLQILHHRNDLQAKITDREIPTIAILVCQEFGGNRARQWVKALRIFSFVSFESNFNRRLHRLMLLLHARAPLVHAMGQHLKPCTDDALDTFSMPVYENIRANRCLIASDNAFRNTGRRIGIIFTE